MRTAGIREARQNLSALLDEVRKGREVVITERGRPVAKLVPPDRLRKGVPNLAAFRRKMPVLDPPLSLTVARDRQFSPGNRLTRPAPSS
jgi:prevent-host-death family protein